MNEIIQIVLNQLTAVLSENRICVTKFFLLESKVKFHVFRVSREMSVGEPGNATHLHKSLDKQRHVEHADRMSQQGRT